MTQPSLLDVAARTVQDTSLEAFARLRPMLSQKERYVFFALWDFVHDRAQDNATGGELAEYMHSLTTSVRPRLTGLHDKGYVELTPARASRARYEGKCHGYAPKVPRAAVERMVRQKSK